MKFIAGLCLTVICFAASAQAKTCEALNHWQNNALDEENLLISVLRLNGRPVLDGIDIYQIDNTFVAPLSVLKDQFKLDWQFDPSTGTLTFANDADLEGLCTFSFTLSNNKVQSGFVWAQDSFDTYLDIQALSLMLGAKVSFSYELLQLNIFSDIAYPGIQANEPVNIATFTVQPEIQPDRILPDKYHKLTYPLVNYRLNSTFDQQDTRASVNLNASFDLFHHAANLRFSGNNDNTASYLRFSRQFAEQDNLLSGLRYEFGDIQLQGNDLISRPSQALGVAISNTDIRQSRSFSSISIEELVLPGWRAQLYRNGQFVAEAFSSNENRVLFENIETFYGNNLFEIKLYGPEGQQETRQQNVNVGNDQITQGDLRYYISASDASQRLLDGDTSTDDFSKKIVANLMYGLSDNLTWQSGFHALSDGNTEQHYLSTALDMSVASANIKTQFAKQLDGGQALFFGINSRLNQHLKLNLSARLFDQFDSQAYQAQRGLKGDVQARLNGSTTWFGGASWGLNLAHRDFALRPPSRVISANLNKNLLGGTFSTSVDFDSSAEQEKLSNRLYYSKNINGWQLSGALEWLPFERLAVQDFYATLRWPQTFKSYNETRLEYRPEQTYKATLRHQYNWRLEQMNFSLGSSLNNGGHWSVNLAISGDIEYDPFNQKLNFHRPRGSRAANIHAFAFLDTNRNAIFDAQDSALSDVVISGNQRWRKQKTTQQGYVQLATTNPHQGLKIEPASLPDPYMQAVDELVYIQTHPGGVNHVSLPVVTFNDIEGAIYQTRDNLSRGVSSIKVALINEQQQVVAQTETEIDGYFYIAQVPPGEYKIQVDPNYLAANNLSIANLPQAINAPKEGDSLRINDLLLVDIIQDTPQLQPSSPVVGYVVQLGVFKKSRSLFEVLKQLPTEHYPLSIYRQHAKGLSYVVLDGFADKAQAQQALNEIQSVPAFSGAYVAPISKYVQAGWHKESEFKNLDVLIDRSHKTLKAMPDNVRVCQLASLQSVTSLDLDEFAKDSRLMLIRRLVAGQRYYSIVGSKAQGSTDCQRQYVQHAYGFQAFDINATRLTEQLF